eukprot:s2160_g6.t1
MAAPRLNPFKAKVEEIASKVDKTKPADGPAKKPCSAYEKQIQGMDGDVSLVKEFQKPDDGMPVVADWITTAESMLFGGVELGREAIDCSTAGQGAAVTAKLPTWKVQHLGLWVDLVEPQASRGPAVSASELMELEDEAQAAKFREVRMKLAQDTAAMCSYNSSKEECTRRSHVVKVMHEKSQVEAGKELLVKHVSSKRLCEGFMERCCRVSQLCDKAWSDPKLDAIYRSAAQAAKA